MQRYTLVCCSCYRILYHTKTIKFTIILHHTQLYHTTLSCTILYYTDWLYYAKTYCDSFPCEFPFAKPSLLVFLNLQKCPHSSFQIMNNKPKKRQPCTNSPSITIFALSCFTFGILFYAARCYAMLCYATVYDTMLYYTLQCSSIPYCTILYYHIMR